MSEYPEERYPTNSGEFSRFDYQQKEKKLYLSERMRFVRSVEKSR